MNRAKRITACLLVVVMSAASLTGCTTFNNFWKAFMNKNPDNDAQIVIGVYEPMTGADKEAGEAEIKGIELAHEMYPEVAGARVELVYADNQSDINVAETATADLIKKGPTAVLGSYGNVYSLVASEYLQEAEIPAIAITNTNPLITKNNPYYFRVCLVDTYQAQAMARYVTEQLRETQAAILIPSNDEHALAMATNFAEMMTARTGNADAIVAYEEYTAGSGDYAAQLQAIQASGVHSVYLCGSAEDVTNIFKEAKKMGLTNLFLGDSTWSEEEFINGVAKYVNGNIAFTTLYTGDQVVTETSTEFLEAYKAKYGDEEPEAAAALGFDAYLMLLTAIEMAGVGCTGEELKKALDTIENFQGASGIISFDSKGDPEKSVVINTLTNKKITPLCTIDPTIPDTLVTEEPEEGEEEAQDGEQ